MSTVQRYTLPLFAAGGIVNLDLNCAWLRVGKLTQVQGATTDPRVPVRDTHSGLSCELQTGTRLSFPNGRANLEIGPPAAGGVVLDLYVGTGDHEPMPWSNVVASPAPVDFEAADTRIFGVANAELQLVPGDGSGPRAIETRVVADATNAGVIHVGPAGIIDGTRRKGVRLAAGESAVFRGGPNLYGVASIANDAAHLFRTVGLF